MYCATDHRYAPTPRVKRVLATSTAAEDRTAPVARVDQPALPGKDGVGFSGDRTGMDALLSPVALLAYRANRGSPMGKLEGTARDSSSGIIHSVVTRGRAVRLPMTTRPQPWDGNGPERRHTEAVQTPSNILTKAPRAKTEPHHWQGKGFIDGRCKG